MENIGFLILTNFAQRYISIKEIKSPKICLFLPKILKVKVTNLRKSIDESKVKAASPESVQKIFERATSQVSISTGDNEIDFRIFFIIALE